MIEPLKRLATSKILWVEGFYSRNLQELLIIKYTDNTFPPTEETLLSLWINNSLKPFELMVVVAELLLLLNENIKVDNSVINTLHCGSRLIGQIAAELVLLNKGIEVENSVIRRNNE